MKQIVIAVLSLQAMCLSAQQSLNLQQCEELFAKNNLMLMAEQYNIDMAKARVIQAKIWERPYLSAEMNAINPQNNKTFDIGSSGQKAVAVQQLIYLGGKKRNEIAFARANKEIAELQFEQLLRTLHFRIQQNFYSIYYDQVKVRNISVQLSNLDSLEAAYSVQAQKGNIPLKDVVRLQSLSLGIKKELMDIQAGLLSEQQDIKILTGQDQDILPVVRDTELDSSFNRQVTLSPLELQTMALEKNPGYLLFKKVSESNELLLSWQRSMAVPDLTLGASYDQRGGAFQNQVNLTLGIQLPLWNSNKGNIMVAEAQWKQSKTLQEQKMLEIRTAVDAAFQELVYRQQQLKGVRANTSQNLQAVYDGVLENFRKHNLSLIEFTDFMESYNQSIQLLNEMKKQVIISRETINLLVNSQAI
jgi:cobalt-zinc-cadmium efflux system outer membrane protein